MSLNAMTHVVCMGGLRPSKSPAVDLKRQAPVDGENHKLLPGVIGTLSVGGRSLRQIDMTPLHECFYMGYTFLRRAASPRIQTATILNAKSTAQGYNKNEPLLLRPYKSRMLQSL